MKCISPNLAWKIGTHYNEFGELKDTVTFSPNEAMKVIGPEMMDQMAMTMPCGKCVECMRNKRMEQATRITHEIEGHEDNCFITLTYNNESIPMTDGQNDARGIQDDSRFIPTLRIKDYQDWLKRFRKKIKLYYGKDVRYFIVGEYGTKGKRPHYHAVIFGWKPDDLVEHKYCGKYWTYRSKFVEKTWKFGFIEIGVDVNAGVAKYCAQYVTKKFNKEDRPNELAFPEFVRASKMEGGLGACFVRKFHHQIAEQGYILTLNRQTGKAYKCSIPGYYKKLLEKEFKEDYELLKRNRVLYVEQVQEDRANWTPEQWLEFWSIYDQKIKTWKENQKRVNRKYEQQKDCCLL